MNDRPFNYGILNCNTYIKDTTNGKNHNVGTRTALLGQIVKVEGEVDHKYVAVRALKQEEKWDSGTFCIPKETVTPVHEKFWQFLVAVASPIQRVKLAQNKSKCDRLMQITKEMTVGFSDIDDVYLGTVKHIGPVKGMGKCIGLVLHVSIKKHFTPQSNRPVHLHCVLIMTIAEQLQMCFFMVCFCLVI